MKAAVTPVAPTTPISTTPSPFDRTNGDLLAITKIDGTNDLAFGGNFSLVYTPDGVSHAATNFAVVDEATGAVLYGGSPANGSSADKYVRSIASWNGVIYIGGDFTSWAGVSRSRAVSLAPTGNPAPAEYAVTSWNPAPGGDVRGLAIDSSAVYLGIDPGSVRAVNPTTGATIWSKSVSGGDVHAVFEDQGYVFVGGLFETYAGVTQHGLVKIQPSDGSLATAFNAHLRADTSDPGGFTGASVGAATSATVHDLTNGTTYTFTVVATNGIGTSGPSASSNSVVPTAGTVNSNSAEGGTAGVSVTRANSGGASGNAFTVLSKGSGAILVYATAAAAHGTSGYSLHGSSGTATLMGWNGYSATSMAIRFYYNPGPTLPSKVMRLADIRNSTATAARVELSASNQLFIQNTAGTTLTTFPHALQANTWYRIELTISISGSAAAINAACYPAD